MGTNNLPTGTDGLIIPSTHNNAIKEALTLDFVPRNVDGEPTDDAGKCGTNTYKWEEVNSKGKVVFNDVHSLDDDLGDVIIKRDGVEKIKFEVGGFSGTALKQATMPRDKIAAAAAQISGSSGAFNTTSLSYVDITNFSQSITTYGRPVFIAFIADNAFSDNRWKISRVGSSAQAQIAMLRNTVIQQEGVFIMSTMSAATDMRYPPGSIYFMDFPGAGTYTYKIQAKSILSGTTLGAEFLKMVVYEL